MARDFDDAIKVSDLTIPSDVTLLTDPDEVVAKVLPPRLEEEPVVAEAAEGEEGAEGAEGEREGAARGRGRRVARRLRLRRGATRADRRRPAGRPGGGVRWSGDGAARCVDHGQPQRELLRRQAVEPAPDLLLDVRPFIRFELREERLLVELGQERE